MPDQDVVSQNGTSDHTLQKFDGWKLFEHCQRVLVITAGWLGHRTSNMIPANLSGSGNREPIHQRQMIVSRGHALALVRFGTI